MSPATIVIAVVFLLAATWWVLANRDSGTHEQPEVRDLPDRRADR